MNECKIGLTSLSARLLAFVCLDLAYICSQAQPMAIDKQREWARWYVALEQAEARGNPEMFCRTLLSGSGSSPTFRDRQQRICDGDARIGAKYGEDKRTMGPERCTPEAIDQRVREHFEECVAKPDLRAYVLSELISVAQKAGMDWSRLVDEARGASVPVGPVAGRERPRDEDDDDDDDPRERTSAAGQFGHALSEVFRDGERLNAELRARQLESQRRQLAQEQQRYSPSLAYQQQEQRRFAQRQREQAELDRQRALERERQAAEARRRQLQEQQLARNAVGEAERCVQFWHRGRDNLLGEVWMYRNRCELVFDIEVTCPGAPAFTSMMTPTREFSSTGFALANCKRAGAIDVQVRRARPAR